MTLPVDPKPNRFYKERDVLPRALRRHRRAKADRGLPPDQELKNLATAYLEQQRKLWPELAESGVLPEPSEAVIGAMLDDFKARHRGGAVAKIDPRLKSPKAGGCYARYSSENSNPKSIIDQMVNCLRKARDEGHFIRAG